MSDDTDTSGTSSGGAHDALADLDRIMDERAGRKQDAVARGVLDEERLSEFLANFAAVCERQVRPAMEAVIERLRHNGGGGEIEAGPHAGSAHPSDPRVTLWMSLEGEIVGHPRFDRHPYLQLDGDSAAGVVRVSEGDMWQGRGGNHSGPVATWQLSEVTTDLVTEHLLAIVRRAAS